MTSIDFDKMAFRSAKLKEINDFVHSTLELDSGVLIQGAQGSGKSSWAHYVYRRSSKGQGLVEIDFRTLEEGGLTAKLVNLENSVLLLENIDFMNLDQQKQLIEVLSAHKGPKRIKCISTSRKNVLSLVDQELFRRDLYYRLAVLKVQIPALREVPEDISTWSEFFIRVFEIIYKKAPLRLSTEAQQKLQKWIWNHNISELENVIERAVITAKDGVVQGSDIRFDSSEGENSAFAPGLTLSEVERRLILQTLELTSQNRTKAAQILGISIRTLRNKLHEYKEAGFI